jgi:asparagine synthase (glutamine-hydrolysing)
MPRQHAEAEVRQMLSVMCHESFYTVRTWSDSELGVYLGWTALRGSFSDSGPHQNETGDTVLVFSGEEYPEPRKRQSLQERGHQIGEAESAYLVHECEDDPSFPAGLNGFFQGVIARRRERTVTIFNDRFGMHRLYWHETNNAFYFAAEAKALLAVLPELRRIDTAGLAEALTLGCVLENRTIFKDIGLIPGGARWVFDRNGSKRAAYFLPKEWEGQSPVDEATFSRELRDVFSANIQRYFAGRERVGVSLTGGLDSRMVMAWQRFAPGTLPCYTWGNTYRDCRDVVVSRDVAHACRQHHDVIPMGQELLSQFPYYADRAVFLTDGCVDVGLAPDVYMNERARLIAPARITGLYGGEVLRGVRAFKHVTPLGGLFQPDLNPQFEEARRTFEAVSLGHPITFAAFKQAPWHHYSSLSLEQSQVTMRSPFLDNDLVKATFRAPASALKSNAPCMALIEAGNPALARIPTDHGLTGSGTLLERASYLWQKFTFKAEYAFDRGMPQWLATIDPLLRPTRIERFFLGRHKPLHFRLWYRDQLASYVREILLDSKSLSRPYVERKMVERIVNGHLNGTRNYTPEIHKLLKFELLHRTFIDGPVAAAASLKRATIG